MDGPWPEAILARCTWKGGSRTLVVQADHYRSGTYKHFVSLRVRPTDFQQDLIWITVALSFLNEPDGATFPIVASFSSY
jgi:hypothetical protein